MMKVKEAGKTSGKHVLVMALSTFPKPQDIHYGEQTRKEVRMWETKYLFEVPQETPSPGEKPAEKDTGTSKALSAECGNTNIRKEEKPVGILKEICTGFYQLEPISYFIRDELKETVTDVILMETKETREVVKSPVFPPPVAYRAGTTDGKGSKGVARKGGKRELPSKDLQNPPEVGPENRWSAAGYFREWLKDFWGEELHIHDIVIDELDPAAALTEVMEKIRKLHDETEDKNTWRLWMDTHGGFRDISMVLISAARFFATDRTDPIKTNGIYSVYHSQKPGVDDQVINQTAFYFTESAEALRRFLEYGQYMAMQFQPYEGSEKHAFISYSHDRGFLTSVRTVFTKFEENGLLYWYDEGIHPGSNWKKVLEEQNAKSRVFVALLTRSYFQSKECWKELIRAAAARKCEGNGDPDYGSMRFLLLEGGLDLGKVLPVRLKKEEETQEVRDLQRELHVSDDDLRKCLRIEDNYQWFQWFSYTEEDASVRPKSTSDPDGRIRKEIDIIRRFLTGK